MKGITYFFVIFTLLGCTNLPYKELVKKEKTSIPLLIENVDIFDGRSETIIARKDVLIENGLIKEISDEIASDPSYQIIDGSKKTLIPGLIDAHVHLSGSGAVPWENERANEKYNLSAYLYAGITTVYDLGGLSKDINGLSEKVKNEDIIGPTIFNTHIPITVENSHPIPLTEQMLPWPLNTLVNKLSPIIDNPAEAGKVIEKYVSKDIDYIKIVCDQIPPRSPEMSYAQLKALIDESHKAGKKVFVHIGSPANAVTAINAGADVLAHGIWRGQLTSEQADLIADSKVPIIYTLSGFNNVAEIYNGEFYPTEHDKFLVPESILLPVTGPNGKAVHDQEVMKDFFKDVANRTSHWKDNFSLLYDRKVPILIGTDSNLPGTYAGSSYFQEIDLLKEYGMSNYEILKAATFLNSRAFMDAPDFGLIKEGYKADLLLIRGNPLLDLQLVKKPELVIVRGSIIDRIEFD